jgi:hypothetical protein
MMPVVSGVPQGGAINNSTSDPESLGRTPRTAEIFFMPSAPDEPCSPISTASPVTPTLEYPFADAMGKIEVIHDHGKIDVEAELRLYEALVAVRMRVFP